MFEGVPAKVAVAPAAGAHQYCVYGSLRGHRGWLRVRAAILALFVAGGAALFHGGLDVLGEFGELAVVGSVVVG